GVLATRITIDDLANDLCGKTRPEHFDGVSTVVAKLFNIVTPHVAIFGQKDWQQLIVVQTMVQDLNLDVEVLSMPTLREVDGLALSSRNQYLNTQQRVLASKLYETLCWVCNQITSGDSDYEKLSAVASNDLLKYGFEKIDYVAIREKNTLKIPTQHEKD